MSSKKQFDYIEEKIKQAASNSLPPFDEKAWQDMELKLGKEKKRRGFFLWWFLGATILAGGAGLYQINQYKPAATAPIVLANNITEQKISADTVSKQTGTTFDNTTEQKTDAAKKIKNQPVQPVASVSNAIALEKQEQVLSKESLPNTLAKKLNNRKAATVTVIQQTDEASPKIKTVARQKFTAAGNFPKNKRIKKIAAAVTALVDTGEKEQPVLTTSIESETLKSRFENENEKIVTVNEKVRDEKKLAETKVTEEKKKEPEPKPAGDSVTAKPAKQSRNKQHGFYVLASGGVEAAGVKCISLADSKIIPRFGIGLGYQFNSRWSIQTGFYVSNKKYGAGGGDYHPKANSYWNQVDMKHVNAACMIYEIPLTIKYQLTNRKKINYYTAAGVSSLIMKRENYNYHYLRYGYYYVTDLQYTGNKHLFSSFNMAAGAELLVSSKFSVWLEPSFTMPLTGVGDGSVKLYAAAVQAGIKYNLPRK